MPATHLVNSSTSITATVGTGATGNVLITTVTELAFGRIAYGFPPGHYSFTPAAGLQGSSNNHRPALALEII